MEKQNTIGIAGVGKMGEALVRGLIVGRVVPASRILVSDAIPARAREIAAKHGVTSLDTVADLARNRTSWSLRRNRKTCRRWSKGSRAT